jgi:hypothetical protein
MPNYRSNVADYDLLYKGETKMGIWVSKSEEDNDFFLPNSQVQYEEKQYKRNSVIKVTIPDWLATMNDLT